MPPSDCDPWFANAPASQANQLEELRTQIKSLNPSVIEELKWSRPCYSNEHGLFCYLQSTKDHVNLGFYRGTSLNDPTTLLQGTGKELRHVKIMKGAVVRTPALVALLRQAAGQ